MSAEPDYLPADVLAEEEPKYLRRQKPLEIRKRKFSRRTWPVYRRVLAAIVAVAGSGLLLYEAGSFFLYSPRVLLANESQIELEGNQFVPRSSVTELFAADFGRSVVLLPLAARRRAIEALPWVESASVQRVLPNRVRIEITERTPVGFLRTTKDLSLVDAYGVILDRPLEADFHFPVISGISESMPRGAREQRLKLFDDFMKGIEIARTGAGAQVSEVDLSDATDIRATLAGLGAAPAGAEPILVHFGDRDFAERYRLLGGNIAQWRASAGRVDSVDLRFSQQVVVNPESSTAAAHNATPALAGASGAAATRPQR